MLQDLVQGQFDDTLLTVDLVVTHKFRYYVYINNKNIKIATAECILLQCYVMDICKKCLTNRHAFDLRLMIS